jgi:4'-phosphopantetheinyl transferase
MTPDGDRGMDPDACVVWWAHTAGMSDDLARLLDPIERARLRHLQRDDDRKRSALGAATLRLAVSDAVGIPPEKVRVERACPTCTRPHGPPRLPGTGLFASVSHSGDWVAVALTCRAAVGIDVERRIPVEESVIGSVVGPRQTPAIRDEADFFVIWTRKESAVKATGDGLRVPLPQVVVSDPDQLPALLSYPGRPSLASQMFDLVPGDGYAAAVTILTGGPVTVRQKFETT